MQTLLCIISKMRKEYNQKKESQILKNLDIYKNKDFSFKNGRIIGSMCTQPLPIAKKAYIRFLETNLGDPELFPGTKEIEIRYISFLKKLLNAPKQSSGIIGTGGTESNIIAIWLAKNLSSKREIIIPKTAHFSFQKIVSLMDIKLIPVNLTKKYHMDILDVKNKIDNNTAAIVGIAGSTELGTIDPIPELSDICKDENIFLHVDAAFGGFIIPFLKKIGYNVADFDLKLKGVSSITIDAHKMGCSAIPLGSLIIREKKWLDKISVETPYISSKKQAGILATRSGAPVAAAYAVSEYLGMQGYKRIVQRCMDTTNYAQKKIENMGLNLITNPTMNILAIKLKKPSVVVDNLTRFGWKVNYMSRFSAIRIVLMPHITKRIIDEFIPYLRKACEIAGESISY